ncbi:GHKL domain-containing protein [Enterococcus casseliflavus]|uniref:GHKL domain-containing protein n=1 Tax=Enterococcus casseliflavus TaxID=37734 RepID=UPI0034D2E3A7
MFIFNLFLGSYTSVLELATLIYGNLITILFKIFLIMILLLVIRKRTGRYEYSPNSISLLMITLPLLSFAIMVQLMFVIFEQSISSNILLNTIVALIFIVNLIILLIYDKISNLYYIIAKRVELEHILSEENKHLVEFKANQKQLLTIQHDLKNYLSILFGYLKSNKITEATNSLAEKLELVSNLSIESYCDNVILNYFLSYKTNQIRNSDIPLDIKVLLPSDLEVSEEFIANILGNLIDNSINACLELPEEKRWIQFLLTYEYNALQIEISNPFTNKKPSLKKGTGIQSIQKSVRKKEGIYTQWTRDGEYFVNIILWK